MTDTITPYSARLSMGRARQSDRDHANAYDAGYHGVSWDEHRDHRADPDDPHQQSLRAAHEQGRSDARAETRGATARRAASRARNVGARTGGYLRSVGKSVTSHAGDVPVAGGSGTFIGVLVGILALILLFVALNHAGAVATFFTGLINGAQWFISPSTLPI